ncbi:MAG: hypothetical protein DRI80_05525 [Chloroflexota bacterium]|nr:MAG: hypothetical protein DRI80_05525 [Chloroflexota bacterium]
MSLTSRITHHASRFTHHTSRFTFDILLVGVGGQGVLSIGEIVAEAACRRSIPVNLYPIKGMAQRGGFVKAQVRLGREVTGPNIPQKGADLVIAMERSEALKAVRFVRPGGDFVLFDHVWVPMAVMLGKADYPTPEQVSEQIQEAGGRMHYLAPESLPLYKGVPVPANIFVLGAAVGHTRLADVLSPSDIVQIVQTKWTRGMERNVFAFQAGLEAPIQES